METKPRTIFYYVTPAGRSPFLEWLENLNDHRGRGFIRSRIKRLELGNPGMFRSLGEGLSELKIDFGPGYRIYFGQDGETLVILLCGGDKSTQSRDMGKAREFWKDYWRRK